MRTKKGVHLDRPTPGFGTHAQRTPEHSILKSLLFELAKVLLERGVTSSQLNEVSTQAFIEAAAGMSRFQNGKINQSRVSVLTGLRRAEVRKFLSYSGCSVPNTQHRSPVESVIAGWCADKRYIDRAGDPRRLVIAGARKSFAMLVKHHARDLPHRAVLNELNRLGVVRQKGKHVELKSLFPLRQKRNLAPLAYLLPIIVDTIRSVPAAHNAGNAMAVRRLILPARNLFDLQAIRERCNSSIENMLVGLSASLNFPDKVPQRGKKTPHSCAVSVIFSETRNS